MRTTIQTEIIINAPLGDCGTPWCNLNITLTGIHLFSRLLAMPKLAIKLSTLQDPQKNKMPFHAVVLNKQENQEFKWRGKLLITGLFDGEHYFQLSTIGENRTRLIHSEEFQGILVRAFLKTLSKPKPRLTLSEWTKPLNMRLSNYFLSVDVLNLTHISIGFIHSWFTQCG